MNKKSAPRIAIQSDRTIHDNGEFQSYSDRWLELCAERGWQADRVDVWSSNFSSLIGDYDGFMWRPGPFYRQRGLMKSIALLQELYSHVVVYPSSRTLMTDSKLDQAYLLQLLDIPTPRTWVFRSKVEALDFVEKAQYPLVLKLESGNSGRNVAMVKSKRDARRVIELMFESHASRFDSNAGVLRAPSALRRYYQSRLLPALKLSLGYSLDEIFWGEKIERGYLYAQEYLPGNEFDTRVCVIGTRAFAFRRLNREGDFRASGSGRIDRNPEFIDTNVVRLAFSVAHNMGTQSNAMDFVYREGVPVLLECNLSFKSYGIRDCPGHWIQQHGGGLDWHEGPYRAEDAIFEGFERELAKSSG